MTNLKPTSHILATSDINQVAPEEITHKFDTITILCNGGGSSGGGNRVSIMSNPKVDDSLLLELHPETRIRNESFGSLVTNSYSQNMSYYNKPATLIFHYLKNQKTFENLWATVSAKLNITRNEFEEYILTSLSKGYLTQNKSIRDQDNEGDFKINDELFSTIRTNALVMPYTATMELTYNCYRACKHCMYTSSPTFDTSNDLPATAWKNILDHLWESGVIALYFSGGEIFRHPEAFEIMSYANQKGFLMTLVSDLTKYDDERLEKLKSLKNLITFYVSLDGANQASHDLLRGNGGFKITTETLKKATALGLPIGVYTMVHKKNLGEFEDTVKLAFDLGAKLIGPGVTTAMGRAAHEISELCLNDDETSILSYKYAKLIQAGIAVPHDKIWNIISPKVIDGSFANPFKAWDKYSHAATHRIHIAPDGKCHSDPKLQYSSYKETGNITNSSLTEIWNSNKFDELRSMITKTEFMVGVEVAKVK